MIPQITWSAHTDIGRVRRENQDRWLARPEDGLFAVADGMGGMPCGAEAATAALAALVEEFVRNAPTTPESWEAVVRKINERVWRRGVAISPVEGIGTTLTLLHFTKDGAKVVHVGDSACFLQRAGNLTQLTEDHTVEAEAARRVARGDHVALQPWAGHILTHCIGQEKLERVDVFAVPVHSGDRFFLCSDGITKVLDLKTIGTALKGASTPEDAALDLIRLALEAGGPDNATGIAMFVAHD